MKKGIKLDEGIEISVETVDAEGTKLAQLERVSQSPGVSAIRYRVEPGAMTTVKLPEIHVKVEFTLFGVVRIMSPHDFGACSRVGMCYSSDWVTNAAGYEPFALFVGPAGECKYLVGLASLEHSCWVRAHVYGGPEEKVISGVKGIGAVEVKRNSAQKGHFKGKGPAVFEDAIYIDTRGGDAYAAVKRYFTWLRENNYPQSPHIPAGQDEVLWHSWYAHQAVIDQDIISKQARIARDLDIRRIQIDAFWDVPPTCEIIWGSNVPNPRRFPDFPALIDQIHHAGQRLALHVNPFVVNPFRFEDQKCLVPSLLIPNGKPVKNNQEKYLLCPRCPQTRDYIMSWVKRMVGEYGIDEVWYDFVDDDYELFGNCDNADHNHLDGTPGENIISILRDVEVEIRRINPNACLWGRRQATNPITRQWEPTISPHDRYLDYLGNLRECLFLHQLAHNQLVEFVCTNWPVGEAPSVVARHMICGIFAGVPAISVDLTKQSPETLAVIKTYVGLYRQNKDWLNAAPRRLLCPEDAIRTVVLDGSHCRWILFTGTAPGIIEIPESIRELRIFSTSFAEIATVLTVKGQWQAVLQDYLLREVKEVRLEKLHNGLFMQVKATPLFSVHLKKVR